MVSESNKPLSESDVDAALKRWSGPVVAPDFADRVMREIEDRKRQVMRTPRRVIRPWAIAAAVMVLVTAVLLRITAVTSLPPGMRLVRFALRVPHAERVALAGSFNGWGHRIALHAHRHGLWTVKIPLRAGQYTYVFVVNGHHIVPDPHAEGYRPDGFGGKNSLIIVGSSGVAA
ncbi:MAG: glycogen-binding domain-containing protein [Acidiferrobacter sp.]